MYRYEVTMVCKEISRAIVIIESDSTDQEVIKDKAWSQFDVNRTTDLEQENFTKVWRLPVKVSEISQQDTIPN